MARSLSTSRKIRPGKDKESNWLPAPNDLIYLVMRLYWPKEGTMWQVDCAAVEEAE